MSIDLPCTKHLCHVRPVGHSDAVHFAGLDAMIKLIAHPALSTLSLGEELTAGEAVDLAIDGRIDTHVVCLANVFLLRRCTMACFGLSAIIGNVVIPACPRCDCTYISE